jgi:hypothetical protein
MSSGKYNLIIEQGATFSRTFTYKNSAGTAVDLTGYTAAAQIRSSFSATEKTDLTVSIPTPANGQIVVSLTATETAALTLESGVWDLELTYGATVTRLLQGTYTLSKEVTK